MRRSASTQELLAGARSRGGKRHVEMLLTPFERTGRIVTPYEYTGSIVVHAAARR